MCTKMASESRTNLSKKFELLLTFVLLWTEELLDRRAKVSNLNIFTIVSLCRCCLSTANNSCVLLNSILLLFNQLSISIIIFNRFSNQCPWCIPSIFFLCHIQKKNYCVFNPIVHTACTDFLKYCKILFWWKIQFVARFPNLFKTSILISMLSELWLNNHHIVLRQEFFYSKLLAAGSQN